MTTYVEGQQVIVNLKYSTWSGYFNNQVHFGTGKSTQTQFLSCVSSLLNWANTAGDVLFDTANTSWSVSTNFTVIAAPVNSSTTDRKGQHCCVHHPKPTASQPFRGCNCVSSALGCAPAVVVLDKANNYASVYENVSSTCVSGQVCCSNSSATLLAANATEFTAFHLGLPQTYRQVAHYQMVMHSPIQCMLFCGQCISCYCRATCRNGRTCSEHSCSRPLATSERFSTVRDELKQCWLVVMVKATVEASSHMQTL